MSQLSKEEIIEIISAECPERLDALFAEARRAREGCFGNKIFMYGFVYFSTWCRNDCNFCYYRKSNNIERYRKEPGEAAEIAEALAASGVHLIDLTMGEDKGYPVLDIVREIKSVTGLPVMLSPGVADDAVIDAAADCGVEWFALYQETHNRELFSRLRQGQDYDTRMRTKKYAAKRGMLIEEGLLTGVGETYEDIADSIIKMGELGAAQMRVMSFVPQEGSPMEDMTPPDPMRELKIIAAMRLAYPGALIPASLDVDGIDGLKHRLNAGANVVTSIIPPMTGLMGVAQSSKDVDGGGRTVAQVTPILETLGLRAASVEEYKEFCRKLIRRAEGIH
ncbi:MAG: methylornithine synthase PylB [Defluviitaleaceae bacterium]|nr:methylornithine synthase PylB [Defluviitaleaceae bacterium]